MRLVSGRAIAPIVAFMLVCASAVSAAAQTGSIRGTVTSSDTHAAINAARVAIETPARVTLTDSHGSYVLRDVPAGTYDVVVTAIGQAPTHVSVTVARGQSQTLNVMMEPGALMLSGLIVSGMRVPMPSNRVTSTVSVLTPQEIITNPARESQDMLREIPSVELPRTSSLVGGSAQIVSIRGVDEGRTNVLFDGIPVTDAWGEWVDWGRVPKNMLDHVEVVEGGTSTLYGNGAIGGVINFYSRPMAPGSATMTVDGGSRDARHVFIGAGVPLTAALNANVSGDYLDGGGYTLLDPAKRGAIDLPSGIVQRNAFARLNYAPAGSKLNAFLNGHLFSDTRATGTPFGHGSRDQKNIDLGANYGALESGLFSLRGWVGKMDEEQRSSTVRANALSCAPPGTARACEDSSVVALIPSKDRGASLQWSHANLFGLQSLTIGGDYRHMDGSFNESDYNTTCPGVNCGKFIRSISSGGDQDLSGAFVQAIVAPVKPLLVELGARVDHWANNNGHSQDTLAGAITYGDRSKTAFSPRVGARFAVTSKLSLHGAAYNAFRAPNLAELYRKQINAAASQITLPNPDLKPESGKGIEGGFDYQPFKWAQVKATYYVADYRDFNSPVTISAGPPAIRQRQNIGKARSKGANASIALRPVEALVVSAGVNYDDDRIVSTDEKNGKHFNRVPSPRQTIRATYSTPMLGSLTGIWRHEGVTTTLQALPLKPFTVLEANYQREIVRGATAFVSVENITNEQYEVNVSGTGAAALYSFGMPRTFRAGLTLTRQ